MPQDAGRTLKSEQDRGPQLRDECAISRSIRLHDVVVMGRFGIGHDHALACGLGAVLAAPGLGGLIVLRPETSIGLALGIVCRTCTEAGQPQQTILGSRVARCFGQVHAVQSQLFVFLGGVHGGFL
jgi:hypothetical protein